MRALRGPGIAFMADANYVCDLPTVIEVGRRLKSLNITWFEEPIVLRSLCRARNRGRCDRPSDRGGRELAHDP
ncbi:MAG: hypothetical protein GY798_04070 [Hyphomicrobiales bacterium]|nr:hypothetical protein [Hyphomicrobiales bacterium]